MVPYISNEPTDHFPDSGDAHGDPLRAAAGFAGTAPIYRQIADQIAADILAGRLAPEDQVMSTNQFAAFYRINPATAAKGFQQLVDEGLLYKRRGIGMFVTADAAERLRARHRDRFYAEVVDPMVAEAQAIGIPLDDVIAHIDRRRNGDPASRSGNDHPLHDSTTEEPA